MFDLSKRRYMKNPKVKDLISLLETYDPESDIVVDGLDEFFIHCTEDNKFISIDLSDFNEDYYNYYKSMNLKFPKKLDKDTRKPFVAKCLDKSRLLKSVIDNVSHQFLLGHGFTQEEIDQIKGEDNGSE